MGKKLKSNKNIRVGKHIVGKVEGDTFIKKVDGSKHFLSQPPAIAFDIVSLMDAKKLGASRVQIIDRETGKQYFAPISTIERKGFTFDRGFGHQIGLTIEFWSLKPPPIQYNLI